MPNVSAWRVDKRKWSATSFSGEGAAREGGRWNSPGVYVVYVSAHLATAFLEKFVHLPKPVPPKMELVQISVDFASVAVEKAYGLPADWRAQPVPTSTQRFGDEWVCSLRTAILAVPSVIVPEETNYILNPNHPDFGKIVISPAQPFAVDPRIAALA